MTGAIKDWLAAGLNVPVAEEAFKKAPASGQPYCVFSDQRTTIGADNRIIFVNHELTVDLYSVAENAELEALLEALIVSERAQFVKQAGYNDDLRLFNATYDFTIIERYAAQKNKEENDE